MNLSVLSLETTLFETTLTFQKWSIVEEVRKVLPEPSAKGRSKKSSLSIFVW